MIGHDQLHAGSGDRGSLSGCQGDTGIHRHDQLHTLLRCPRNIRRVQAVAILPQRQTVKYIRPLPLQIGIQQGCGGDAVHIVITVNENALMPVDSGLYPLRRHIHIRKGKGIGLLILPGQKTQDLLRRCQAARRQQQRQKGVQLTAFRHFRRQRFIQRRHLPALDPHPLPSLARFFLITYRIS